MKRSIQKGFTLLELMIVVAIIGFLAAVALPAYQDYVKRSRVSEGLALASGAKTALAEYVASNNEWPASGSAAGIEDGTAINGNSVVSVTVGASDGVITIDYNTKVGGGNISVAGATTAGGVTWDCKGGSVEGKYRPSECRN